MPDSIFIAFKAGFGTPIAAPLKRDEMGHFVKCQTKVDFVGFKVAKAALNLMQLDVVKDQKEVVTKYVDAGFRVWLSGDNVKVDVEISGRAFQKRFSPQGEPLQHVEFLFDTDPRVPLIQVDDHDSPMTGRFHVMNREFVTITARIENDTKAESQGATSLTA